MTDYNSPIIHPHGVFIIGQAKEIATYKYPNDLNKLRKSIEELHTYLETNNLTQINLYTELHKKVGNVKFMYAGADKEYPTLNDLKSKGETLEESIFHHMKGVIDLHAILICEKNGLKYPL